LQKLRGSRSRGCRNAGAHTRSPPDPIGQITITLREGVPDFIRSKGSECAMYYHTNSRLARRVTTYVDLTASSNRRITIHDLKGTGYLCQWGYLSIIEWFDCSRRFYPGIEHTHCRLRYSEQPSTRAGASLPCANSTFDRQTEPLALLPWPDMYVRYIVDITWQMELWKPDLGVYCMVEFGDVWGEKVSPG
jgi:hypothetical protein